MKFFLSILAVLTFLPTMGLTIDVGPGTKVLTLKAAIAKAFPGDTIYLHEGTYKEGNIIIFKPLVIIGKGRAVLDGESKYEILTVSSAITIKGIVFMNAGYSSMNDFAAIKVLNSSRVLIEGNEILNSPFAIHLSGSNYCEIRNNRIKGTKQSEHLSGNGIHLWKCNNMVIADNSISGHRDGIYLEFVTHSIIAGNESDNNIRYGLHFMFSHDDQYVGNTFRNNGAGVAVMYSKGVRMTGNDFQNNWGPSAYGILLKDITDSYISNNRFYKNTVAIHMEGSSRIIIEKNIFRENGWATRIQSSCDNNTFVLNNFLGNTFDLATNGSMVLNHFEKNYWDKYEGYDMARDGIGDVSYHPVSMYSMIVEQNPQALILMRSFMVSLIDKAEKAIPGMTPTNLVDNFPLMKPLRL